jgi:hypothetical protein
VTPDFAAARIDEEKIVDTGPIDAPNGRRYEIPTVWIDEGTGLRLVTAHPA